MYFFLQLSFVSGSQKVWGKGSNQNTESLGAYDATSTAPVALLQKQQQQRKQTNKWMCLLIDTL